MHGASRTILKKLPLDNIMINSISNKNKAGRKSKPDTRSSAIRKLRIIRIASLLTSDKS